MNPMSKNAPEVKAPEAAPVDVAALMAQMAEMQKQMATMQAAAAASAPKPVDFSQGLDAASKAGFKAQVVEAHRPGASPALRVDY